MMGRQLLILELWNKPINMQNILAMIGLRFIRQLQNKRHGMQANWISNFCHVWYHQQHLLFSKVLTFMLVHNFYSSYLLQLHVLSQLIQLWLCSSIVHSMAGLRTYHVKLHSNQLDAPMLTMVHFTLIFIRLCQLLQLSSYHYIYKASSIMIILRLYLDLCLVFLVNRLQLLIL